MAGGRLSARAGMGVSMNRRRTAQT